MKDTEILQIALGLAPPWPVSTAEFDAEEKRLNIRLDFPKESTFDKYHVHKILNEAVDQVRREK